jgi:maleylacetate reductase
VVLDPAATVHMTERLWLSTGIRAVDHCVEGICSNEANPYANAQALHGLSLLTRGLPRVKAVRLIFRPGSIARCDGTSQPMPNARH